MIMTEVYENLGYGLVHAQIVTVLNRLMETLHLHPVKIISLAPKQKYTTRKLHKSSNRDNNSIHLSTNHRTKYESYETNDLRGDAFTK
jgi:hypothetical protein